ncbi:MAG: Rpn family recombination-promoting nuclease/putative transposase [Clostridia bacterium]|nr:Rpn family recombination-promoting nuclease/putative transposase [Clostridia bacterium]
MPDKLLELKNDLVFQKVFGIQKNSSITKHFLSLILGRKIHNVDLDVNKRMLGSRVNSKTGRLDIRVKFNNGEDCNIELQVLPYEYMAERMLEYWAGMYDNKINSGQGYDVLKPSISILIANYKLKELKDIVKYHTIWNLREKDFPNKIISNNIELHILEIPKIKIVDTVRDELAQWLKFIENPGNKEVEKFMGENRFLKQAKEELAYLSGDPDFQLLVESRAGMLKDIYYFKKKAAEDALVEGQTKGLAEGIKKGLAEGRAEGRKENQKETAKKLLKLKMPIDQIAEVTNLTREEIEKIRK